MSIWIQHLETITPEMVYSQEYASKKMQEWTDDERQRRMVRALYRKSGIDKRHSVITSFDNNLPGDFFPLGDRRQTLASCPRQSATRFTAANLIASRLSWPGRPLTTVPGSTRPRSRM